jgi:hypothetical protein
MKAETINIRIVGVTPMLHHAGRLADPLDPATIELASLTAKRMKTRADHEAISRAEWAAGLWLDKGRPCIPGEAIEAAIVGAARSRKKGKTARAGFQVPDPAVLQYEGPADLDELWENPDFRLRRGVRVNAARTMRTRARFPKWSADIAATFLPGLLNRDELMDFFKIAGALEGLGDWRPKYGRFTVLAP